MAVKDDILGHFEVISDAFDGVYEGRQNSLLYKLVDVLFRRAILDKRKELTLKSSGDVRNKKILDIGCGSGIYSIAFGRQAAESVLGIDISPSMIALAESKAKINGLNKICRFENVDFLGKDFSEKFDIVIAIGVFDYIQQPQDFLYKIREIFKEMAILSFPIKWTVMTPLRMAWLSKRKCPNFYYTKGQIKRLFDIVGFKIISIYKIGTFLIPGNYLVVCKRR